MEFKLALCTALKRNVENQVEIYKKANETEQAVRAIMFFSLEEETKVKGIIEELGLKDDASIVLIEARNDNKPSGSLA